MSQKGKSLMSGIDRCFGDNIFALCGKCFLKLYKLENDSLKEVKDMGIGRKARICTNVAWHPQDHNLLAASILGPTPAIGLWDTESKASDSYHLLGFHERITALSWNRKNTDLLASSSQDRHIKIWDRRNGISKRTTGDGVQPTEPVVDIDFKELVRDCQFSPTDEYSILCSGNNGSMSIFDTRKPNLPWRRFEYHQKEVEAICWHPTNPKIFCSGARDKNIYLWDIDKVIPQKCFKDTDGISKIKFLESNPHYIITSYSVLNFYVSIWNVNFIDMPEYKYPQSDVGVGFSIDKESKRLITLLKYGKTSVSYLEDGIRLVDNITTNVITFTNSNEIYSYHDDKIQKEPFDKSDILTSNLTINCNKNLVGGTLIPEKIEEINKNSEIKNEDNSFKSNINKISMFNFNLSEAQFKEKLNSGKNILFLGSGVQSSFTKTLKQFYFLSPEQIHCLFSEYIFNLDSHESLFANKRFGEDNQTLKRSDKLVDAISYNFECAKNKIKNYNHIAIWKQLEFLSEQESFKKIIRRIYDNNQDKKSNQNSKPKNKREENEKNRKDENKNSTKNGIYSSNSLQIFYELIKKHVTEIIEYLIETHGDLYLAVVISCLFHKFLITDGKVAKRVNKLRYDCISELRKLKLFVDANFLKKYCFLGINNEYNKEEYSRYNFIFSCKDCRNPYDNKEGKCICGRIIKCERCNKKIKGLYIWCTECGHGSHLLIGKQSESPKCECIL